MATQIRPHEYDKNRANSIYQYNPENSEQAGFSPITYPFPGIS